MRSYCAGKWRHLNILKFKDDLYSLSSKVTGASEDPFVLTDIAVYSDIHNSLTNVEQLHHHYKSSSAVLIVPIVYMHF